MTALKKYTRLEASGLWRESTVSNFVEILISIGKTSVILSDYNDNPLSHWSLSAVRLVSRNAHEAIFSTDPDSGEILVIKDLHMIEALLLFINKDTQEANTNKVLIKICLSFFIILLATFLLYFPSKIKELVASVITKPHEKQIIAPFLKTHISSSGGICTSKKTDEITRRILNLVDETNSFLTVSIVRNQKMNVLHLPSGKLLISRKFLENSSNGKELLQLLENELPRAIERKPLKTLINQQTTFQLIKFIIGFDPKLSIKELNDFLRPLPKSTPKQIEKLDDFSWVALQNACLN